MADITSTSNLDDDAGSPAPIDEQLRLNLQFCPTTQLINELKRRCSPCVLVMTTNDQSDEIEPAEEFKESPHGAEYIHYFYSGSPILALGLLEAARHTLRSLCRANPSL